MRTWLLDAYNETGVSRGDTERTIGAPDGRAINGVAVDLAAARRTLDLIQPDLDAALREHVKAELKGQELDVLVGLDPPVFEVESESGALSLSIAFAGSMTTTEWDGSTEEAMELVRQAAPSLAFSVSDIYWTSGGWRTRTTFE